MIDSPPIDRRFVTASVAYVLACTYITTFLWQARTFLPPLFTPLIFLLWVPIIVLFLSTIFVRYVIDEAGDLVVWYGPLRLRVPADDIDSVEKGLGDLPSYVRAYRHGTLYLSTRLAGRIVVRRREGWPRTLVISPGDPGPFLALGKHDGGPETKRGRPESP
ncbi:MAG: hypothetical protein QF415_03495 [Candidatus Undinarchaeales archaeon]|nr:hypothetical protein [Candidatus Undinarchaeales archaeon]MDP7494374.1 hypothetical protein [Candidatus Undinarchaeales archaeon]